MRSTGTDAFSVVDQEFLPSGTNLTASSSSDMELEGKEFDKGSVEGKEFDKGSVEGKEFDKGSVEGKEFDEGSVEGKEFDEGSVEGKEFDEGSVDVRISFLLNQVFQSVWLSFQDVKGKMWRLTPSWVVDHRKRLFSNSSNRTVEDQTGTGGEKLTMTEEGKNGFPAAPTTSEASGPGTSSSSTVLTEEEESDLMRSVQDWFQRWLADGRRTELPEWMGYFVNTSELEILRADCQAHRTVARVFQGVTEVLVRWILGISSSSSPLSDLRGAKLRTVALLASKCLAKGFNLLPSHVRRTLVPDFWTAMACVDWPDDETVLSFEPPPERSCPEPSLSFEPDWLHPDQISKTCLATAESRSLGCDDLIKLDAAPIISEAVTVSEPLRSQIERRGVLWKLHVLLRANAAFFGRKHFFCIRFLEKTLLQGHGLMYPDHSPLLLPTSSRPVEVQQEFLLRLGCFVRDSVCPKVACLLHSTLFRGGDTVSAFLFVAETLFNGSVPGSNQVVDCQSLGYRFGNDFVAVFRALFSMTLSVLFVTVMQQWTKERDGSGLDIERGPFFAEKVRILRLTETAWTELQRQPPSAPSSCDVLERRRLYVAVKDTWITFISDALDPVKWDTEEVEEFHTLFLNAVEPLCSSLRDTLLLLLWKHPARPSSTVRKLRRVFTFVRRRNKPTSGESTASLDPGRVRWLLSVLNGSSAQILGGRVQRSLGGRVLPGSERGSDPVVSGADVLAAYGAPDPICFMNVLDLVFSGDDRLCHVQQECGASCLYRWASEDCSSFSLRLATELVMSLQLFAEDENPWCDLKEAEVFCKSFWAAVRPSSPFPSCLTRGGGVLEEEPESEAGGPEREDFSERLDAAFLFFESFLNSRGWKQGWQGSSSSSCRPRGWARCTERDGWRKNPFSVLTQLMQVYPVLRMTAPYYFAERRQGMSLDLVADSPRSQRALAELYRHVAESFLVPSFVQQERPRTLEMEGVFLQLRSMFALRTGGPNELDGFVFRDSTLSARLQQTFLVRFGVAASSSSSSSSSATTTTIITTPQGRRFVYSVFESCDVFGLVLAYLDDYELGNWLRQGCLL
jgi:hypothetical protein